MNKNLDYAKLSLELGLQGIVSGQEFRAKCPLHSDQNPSFSLNIDTGLWLCHAGCGSGNFITLISRVMNCSKTEAVLWTENNGQSSNVLNLSLMLARSLGQNPILNLEDEELGWKRYYDFIDCKAMPLWFLKRGFTWETISHWGIKFDPSHDAVVLPIIWEDIFHGIVVRPYQELPKYQYSTGLKKSKLFFGEIFPNEKYIILVEGVLDALWLWQLGYNSVSILGDSLSQEQCKILQRYRYGEVVLGLDNDEAGHIGTENAINLLVTNGWLLPQIKRIDYPGFNPSEEGYRKDAQDCTLEEFREVFWSREDIINGLFTERK